MKNKYKVIVYQTNKKNLEENSKIELFTQDYSQFIMLLTALKLSFNREKYMNDMVAFKIDEDETETQILLNHINISF